ncbi:hypothetical protein MTP10_19780 [Nonomuraea sp. 3-1Str]|nr:hypothetical protein [Nonomuraea sp. 3-1Str]
MPIWTQDYPALAQAADAASRVAYTLAHQHLPSRASDAHALVENLFFAGLERTSPGGSLNLITMTSPRKVRFELHYPDDKPVGNYSDLHQAVSELADAYGERPTSRGGCMIYAELWAVR